ncbi:hypothetical protein [Duganella sp. HH101]
MVPLRPGDTAALADQLAGWVRERLAPPYRPAAAAPRRP